MRHPPERIESALAPLVGLSLWASARAADMQSFRFVPPRAERSRRPGEARLVGEAALHVQCSWRLQGPDGIVTASRDRFVPAGDPYEDPPDWQWDAPGANRCDERLSAWFAAHASDPVEVEAVSADVVGGIRVALRGGFLLEIFPDDSLDAEHWRFLRPAADDPQFVVGGTGIEEQ
jgi:hypothetical protein